MNVSEEKAVDDLKHVLFKYVDRGWKGGAAMQFYLLATVLPGTSDSEIIIMM